MTLFIMRPLHLQALHVNYALTMSLNVGNLSQQGMGLTFTKVKKDNAYSDVRS